MKKVLTSLSAIVLLSGCQTTIDASQYTVLDPDVNFHTDAPIVVSTFDEHDLGSKYYIRPVIAALNSRGFTAVYTSRDVADKGILPVAAIYIKLNQESNIYKYESADYGMFDSGNATTTCTGSGYFATCNTTNQKILGVTGSSTKTGVSLYTSFALHYYDLSSKEKVMFTMGSTFDKSCSVDYLYTFLINETIARTDFKKPLDYKYSVKLPDGVKCE